MPMAEIVLMLVLNTNQSIKHHKSAHVCKRTQFLHNTEFII